MAPLTLTILGAGPAAPNPGGANSGYLLRQGDSAVVMDCGAGVAGRIVQQVPANRLAGVAISHLHPDHYFDPVQHYILSHGMRVRSESGAVLAFSSDVAPCPQLIDVARDADLFLCESALLEPSQDEKDHKRRGHMSAGEAGAAAARANARRLLITHYRSGEKNDAHHLAAAQQTFSGPVELAREGANYVVG